MIREKWKESRERRKGGSGRNGEAGGREVERRERITEREREREKEK